MASSCGSWHFRPGARRRAHRARRVSLRRRPPRRRGMSPRTDGVVGKDLRRLPQRAREGRRAGARGARPVPSVGARRDLGEGHPEAARRPDAARRDAAAGGAGNDRAGLLSGIVARRGSRGGAQCRAAGAAPAEPRRVRQRHPRSAGARGRCRGAAAARRFERRIRQQRRRPRRVAGPARALPRRGPEVGPRWRWGIRKPTRPRVSSARRRTCRSASTAKGCRWARAAASWPHTRFRSTASTSSRSSCWRRRSARSAGSNTSTGSRCMLDGERDPSGRGGRRRGLRRLGRQRHRRAQQHQRAADRPRAGHGGSPRDRRGVPRTQRHAGRNRLQFFQRTNVDTTDHTGLPHIESVTIAGPFNPPGGRTPSRDRILACRPVGRAGAGAAVRQADHLDAGAPRLSAAGHGAGGRPPADVLQRRPQGRHLREGIERALRAILASPSSCSASSRIRADAAGGASSDQRPRARVPAVILPVEQHPRRRAPRRGRAGPLRSRPCWSGRCGACWPTPRRGAGRQLRRPVAAAAEPARPRSRIRTSSPISTTTCVRRSGARPSCCSRA